MTKKHSGPGPQTHLDAATSADAGPGNSALPRFARDPQAMDRYDLVYEHKSGEVAIGLHRPDGSPLMRLSVEVPPALLIKTLRGGLQRFYLMHDLDYGGQLNPLSDADLPPQLQQEAARYALRFLHTLTAEKAQVRCGILPYGKTRCIPVPDAAPAATPVSTGEVELFWPDPCQPYHVELEYLPELAIDLDWYGPVEVDFPLAAAVTPADVEERLQLLCQVLGPDSGVTVKQDGQYELDQAFIDKNFPDSGNLDGLRSRVRLLMEHGVEDAVRRELEQRCLDALLPHLVGDIPEAYLDTLLEQEPAAGNEAQPERKLDSRQEKGQGRTGASSQVPPADRRETLRREVAADAALRAFAAHMDIEVDEDVFFATFVQSFPGASREQFYEYASCGNMQQLYSVTIQRLALGKLVAGAIPANRKKFKLL